MIDGFSPAVLPAPSGPPRWMISFADLLSLILTFFVLIFSMSTPNKKIEDNDLQKAQEAAYSVNKTEVVHNIKTSKTDSGLSTDYLYDILKEKTGDVPQIKLRQLDDRLVISITSSDYTENRPDIIADILKSMKNRIDVYTGDIDQSLDVVKTLHQKGVERNISIFEAASSSGKIDIIIYP